MKRAAGRKFLWISMLVAMGLQSSCANPATGGPGDPAAGDWEYRMAYQLGVEAVEQDVPSVIDRVNDMAMLDEDEVAEDVAEDVAKELANPTNALGKLSFNLNYISFDGDLPGASSQDSLVLQFQPALPYPLENGMTFFARPLIPIILEQPAFNGSGFTDEGVELGDIGFDFAYGGPVNDSGLVMLGGLVGTLPTATNDNVGKNQWSLGPELVVAQLAPWGAVGLLVTHQWDVASTSSSASDVNVTAGQYFYTYLLSDGWAIGAGPAWSYNWEADSGDRLTLPIGTGISRTVVLGKTPWKFGLEFNYFVEHADTFGPEWSVRLVVTPIIPLPW